MRRAVVALTVLGLVAGTAACESTPPADPPATPAPPAAHRPATAAVCAEAARISEAGATTYTRTLDEMYVLAKSDLDQATIDARSAEKERVLDETLDVWAAKLTTLASQDIDPSARTALQSGVTAVQRAGDPSILSSLGETRVTLERLGRTITAAC
ncbi:hypothetical protein O7635_21865 [Asanoa sp. WMMD1127]|uniref:hypothetical protein n=1 Tax=Asanoa sp. WMMD1127 TaxID=3016107 RepID=UPI002416D689|nr:hypothetical protein [Asanoa sp. WMMD1127]MDG4824507.1 hypothetical protein [Asanoa sp. WMMD1127]